MSIWSVQKALLTEEVGEPNPLLTPPPTEDIIPINLKEAASPPILPKLFSDTKIASLYQWSQKNDLPYVPRLAACDKAINKHGVIWEQEKVKEELNQNVPISNLEWYLFMATGCMLDQGC